MSALLGVLERFSKKQATQEAVMRAIASHDSFFVPLGFATRFERTEFERIVQLGKTGGPPPGEVYVFSDESCLDLVANTPLGGFVTPVSGVEWLSRLDEAQDVKVKVNPGGPQAHFWFMGKDAVPLARLWGQAIGLEQLMVANDLKVLALAMKAFEGFTVLSLPNGAIATAQGTGGYENPAMLFTAPDCFEKVLAQAPGLKPVHMTGAQLFHTLPRAGVDGIVFNPLGPGVAAAYPLSLITGPVQLS
jgi:hypothetical protein